jgi:hypothetical protein
VQPFVNDSRAATQPEQEPSGSPAGAAPDVCSRRAVEYFIGRAHDIEESQEIIMVYHRSPMPAKGERLPADRPLGMET